ncbi:hypothetical protein SAMN00120144_4137 [Hymenobacter roseosalivarius DSM 11622]|uniref:Uncharacterized protein n=1 Tax=Hymenobacter roseosalivarius DSM 11622 TaxID=645990 RepID=A0A1W1W664_9BACT|nr:hypothetical protein SAMN00120144_4137 [Hymenobacter roseosalivarius DSM 11622]
MGGYDLVVPKKAPQLVLTGFFGRKGDLPHNEQLYIVVD